MVAFCDKKVSLSPVHTFVIAMNNINKLKSELLPHPLYSPDFTPSNYVLFPSLRKWFGGKKFPTMKRCGLRLTAILRSSTVLTINEISKLGIVYRAKWRLCWEIKTMFPKFFVFFVRSGTSVLYLQYLTLGIVVNIRFLERITILEFRNSLAWCYCR